MGKTRLRNPTAFSYGIGGSRRGASSITNLFNFINAQDGGLGAQGFWNIVNPAPGGGPGPLPDYSVQIIGLLDYSYYVDLDIKNTMEWYSSQYPFLYPPIQFLDTQYSDENTLALLNQYYNRGYRYFFLTSHSSTIINLISWFEQHGDAIGISCYAQSDALNVPKKIYTLTSLGYQKMSLYANTCIKPYSTVYYFYASSELYCTALLVTLQELCTQYGVTLVSNGTLTTSSAFTTANINALMSTVQTGINASIIIAYSPYTNLFYNAFDSTTPVTGYPFYDTALTPIITNEPSCVYFNGVLNITSTGQANLSASYLWQLGYQNFNRNLSLYASPALNALDIAFGLVADLVVSQNLPAQSDTMSFDVVKATSNGNSLPVSIFRYDALNNTTAYIPTTLYYQDEVGNVLKSTITNYQYTPVAPTPISPPFGPTKKAAALLSLTGPESTDTNDLKTLYYLWATTTEFLQMPIYDTQSSVDTTLALLQQCYDNGVRLFYGFNTTSVLTGVLDWFLAHPDVTGVSPSSSANSLAVQKNVYRLQIVDSYVLQSISAPLSQSIASGGRIFYMYSSGQVACTEVLTALQTTYGSSNVKPYAALPDSSNLTQAALRNFFVTQNNITSRDVIVVFLFIGNQINTYVSQFNQSMIIPASQYDISQTGFVSIDLSTTSLNNLYNLLALESITTSYLWDKTLVGVGKEFFASNALNGLYMITQLSKNQSVYSLGSYNGALQFNEFKDIAFGSVSNYLYSSGTYRNTYIYCRDPLYGQLTFNKIN